MILATLHFISQQPVSGSPSIVTSWVEALAVIAAIPVVVSATAVYRRHNCHVRHCWRVQWKTVRGTDHVVCRHHHPSDPPTHARVIADHKAARAAAARQL